MRVAGRPFALLLLLLLLLPLPGCSLLVVRGPSASREHGEAPECNASGGAVGGDVALALLGLIAVAASDESRGVGFAVTALGAGSAAYGVSRNARCRSARLAYAEEREELALEHARLREAARKPPVAAPPPPSLPSPPRTSRPPPVRPAAAAAGDAVDDAADAGSDAADAVDDAADADSDAADADSDAADADSDADDEGDGGAANAPDAADAADPGRWRAFWRKLP